MVNRATRRFTRQQGKHRTFISQFLQDPEYWSAVPGYEPATSRPAVKCTTNWANTAADTSIPKSRISFDPGLHNNRRKKRAFCHMSLNKRLLILKKGKPDYSRMTPFFSGLNATEKCKCNETFKKGVVSHIHNVFTYVWKECKVAYQLKG